MQPIGIRKNIVARAACTLFGFEEQVERISVPRDRERSSLGPDHQTLLDLGRVRNAAVAKSDGGHQQGQHPCCQEAYKYIKTTETVDESFINSRLTCREYWPEQEPSDVQSISFNSKVQLHKMNRRRLPPFSKFGLNDISKFASFAEPLDCAWDVDPLATWIRHPD